ncbi:hypothetical protein [Spirillospora sp. NPDC047279]|uniref:alpha/beta hydrolase family esterase n=1 Tax=Spirillospora sp. NPDC047279 TaxID=3155478 RepID=UPI0033D03BB6
MIPTPHVLTAAFLLGTALTAAPAHAAPAHAAPAHAAPAHAASAHAAPAHAAPSAQDRVTVTTDGYTLAGDLTSGSIAVLDNVATYETNKIQGSGTLGTATVTSQIAHNGLALKGTFTLKDAGTEITADVNGGITAPAEATVRWQGTATVRRGTDTSRRQVTVTIEDRHPDPGDHAIRITHAGQARNAILRLPDDYDGTPRPVLFHFPGLFETPGLAEYFGRMADYARTRGFIMITPEHYGPGWQGVPAGTPSPDVDDPGFVHRLQDILIARFNADPKRLYASGMSNGGFFTSKLACDNDRFAAYAPVSGQLSAPATCRPGRHVPIVLIHGDGDYIVPYSGVQPAVDFWTRNNGCGTTPVSTPLPDTAPNDNTTVVRHDYPGCPSGGPVTLYQIKGGGHNWPGGLPFLGPFLGGTTYDIDANEVIWRFASQHRLP